MSAKNDQPNVQDRPEIISPTSTATQFVRYVLGFGVWVVVGLAPFLGRADVPGFTPLLALYPHDLQRTVIPLSGLLMGIVAVILEFQAGERPERSSTRRWFRRAIWILATSFVALTVAYPFLVTSVSAQGGDTHYAVVTGPAVKPGHDCGCADGTSRVACLESISLDPVAVAACFGEGQVRTSSLALSILYLLLTGGFAASVAALLLHQKSTKTSESSKRPPRNSGKSSKKKRRRS